ncbi:hypothetical protein [Aurantivibrio plasticivorans]
MRQEVNLLRVDNVESLKPLSANAIALATVMLTLLLCVISVFMLVQQSALKQRIEKAKLDNQTISTRLAQLKASRPLSQRPQLLAQIQTQQKQVQRREELRNIIGAQDLGNFAGFSEYLTALATQADDNIALTDIRILEAGTLLELEGWTRRPSVVPGYLYLLRTEEVFKSVRFGTLSIAREKIAADKAYFILGNENTIASEGNL